jgi:hypothetical protein
MMIDRASYGDVLTVAQAMRERDYAEFSAVSATDNREDLAKLLAERYGDRDDTLCGGDERGSICIGGTIETRPNVITLLFFATDRFSEIGFPMTRFIKNNLFPRYFQAGAHRIEAVSIASHHDAHRWLELLGLTPETGPMRGYGKGGEAFIQFSMVRDVCSSGA